jgi:CDP-diacylglycerol--glycerol-3-phosphate 3-phosphatidyltransferase
VRGDEDEEEGMPATRPSGTSAAGGGAVRTVEPVRTVANVVTLVRTVASVALAVVALATVSVPLLIAAYGVYWVGDMADGWSARRLGQETRLGAVFDIVSDRACTILCAAAFIRIDGDVAVPIAAFLVQFAVLDTMLTLGFLYWPVLGPNDMHRVDRTIYRWNWSPPAKATNTALVVLLCLLGLPIAATACAVAVGALKIWSLFRMRGLSTGTITAN